MHRRGVVCRLVTEERGVTADARTGGRGEGNMDSLLGLSMVLDRLPPYLLAPRSLPLRER